MECKAGSSRASTAGIELLFPELGGPRADGAAADAGHRPRWSRAGSRCPHYDNYGYDYWQQLPDGASRSAAAAACIRGRGSGACPPSPGTTCRPTSTCCSDERLGVEGPRSRPGGGAGSPTPTTACRCFAELRPGVMVVGAHSGHGNVLGSAAGRAATALALGGPADRLAELLGLDWGDHGPNRASASPLSHRLGAARTRPCGAAPRRGRRRARRPPRWPTGACRDPRPARPRHRARISGDRMTGGGGAANHPRALVESVRPRGEDSRRTTGPRIPAPAGARQRTTWRSSPAIASAAPAWGRRQRGGRRRASPRGAGRLRRIPCNVARRPERSGDDTGRRRGTCTRSAGSEDGQRRACRRPPPPRGRRRGARGRTPPSRATSRRR